MIYCRYINYIQNNLDGEDESEDESEAEQSEYDSD